MIVSRFNKVYSTRRTAALQMREFLVTGLGKLERAMRDIEQMRHGLADKEKYLASAQRQAQQLLMDMALRKADAEKDRAVVVQLTVQLSG